MSTDAAASATAKDVPSMPDIITKPSGLISGEDVRKAITGPQGSAVASIDITTAIVPHAQNGVNAPKATVAGMDTDERRISQPFILSGSMYVCSAAATSMPMTSAGAL